MAKERDSDIQVKCLNYTLTENNMLQILHLKCIQLDKQQHLH